MTSTTYDPTAEQQLAVDLAKKGDSLAIEAGAGTGKTSTLILIALMFLRFFPRKRIQYVAFNKSIVKEASRKFPRNVTCTTAHALAVRAVRTKAFNDRQESGKRMRSIDIANVLKIDGITLRTFTGESKQLSRSFLAGLVMSGISEFCKTADPEPTGFHIPRVEGLDAPGEYTVQRDLGRRLEGALARAWADLTDEHGALPFTLSIAMATYLKMWQLSGPRIGADVILYDEAQDANPVMVAIVAAQKHAQLVWVGDSQQQIYEFTGAVNALASVPSDQRAFLTQSFRFGPAVAEVANALLAQIPSAELRLSGFDEITSVVGPVVEPDAILARTNATAVRAVLAAQAQDKRPHLVGGGTEIVKFAKAAAMLMDGLRVEHPELACFETWTEVQEYVEQDEQGGDLRLQVKLVDDFGVPVILGALDNMVREEDADLVVSTAHKSKGREWGSVQLAGDFPDSKVDEETGETKPPSQSDIRLMYVAATRAQYELDIDAVPFIRASLGEPSVAPIIATTAAKAAQSVSERVARPVEVSTPADPKSRQTASQGLGYVGAIGETIELTLGVEMVNPTPTQYGSYVTKLTDADGHRFAAFLKEKLVEGGVYTGTWTVKNHGEFRGVKETTIKNPSTLTRVEDDPSDEDARVLHAAAVERARLARA